MAELTPHNQPSGIGPDHLLVASIAAVLSVAIHVGLAVMATYVNVNMSSVSVGDLPPRNYEPVQLGDVDITPAVQENVLAALRALGDDGIPDVAVAAETLAVAPEEGVTEPPSLDEVALVGEMENTADPTPPPLRAEWEPRQEIIVVETTAVGDVMPRLERRMIPAIERVQNAPDIVLPVNRDQIGSATGDGLPVSAPSVADIVGEVVGGMDTVESQAEVVNADVAPGGTQELFEETPEEVSDVEPIERVLTARVETFSSLRDFRHGYFRLVVERAGESLLPIRPKDIILVQDCSASMSEQRLYFCREGLRRSLAHIGPADRFNIAKFADRTETCFDDWVMKTPETLDKAEAYINAMKAGGNTDLFASMQDLLSLECDSSRPAIAFVVTDGLANKGITDSSEIIGEFSRRNDGKISVFTMGASQLANRYLIDLLSYCNKGYVDIVAKGRWDIPESAEAVMKGISRPVLGDLRLQFAADSSCEVYPQQVSNLYLDRPLVLYGRYRKGEKQLVFQAVGRAGETPCDLVFDLPLAEEGRRGADKTIRQSWAQQKIYHLIGEYARTRDAAVLKELRRTAGAYHEPIPYKRSLF